MTPRRGTSVAIAICALAVGMFGAGVALFLVSTGLDGQGILSLALLVVFSAVGVLVVSRQPRNPIGWIFCAAALSGGLSTLAHGYARYWMDGNGARPLGEAAAAYANAAWAPGVLVPATFLVLLFPDGRLLSRRWRWVARGAAVGITCLFLGELTQAGELDDFPGLENAYGIDHPLHEVIEGGSVLVAVALIASPISLYLRLRRSVGQERQQIKWLVWAGALAGATVLTGSTLGYEYAGETVSNVTILLSILALPAATGVAILRYRLYDIDIVINRTLVYGALTIALGTTYLGLVLLAGLAVGQSDLAIAASTLAVAALFRPLRARIQAGVDRRFYRRRYDAVRTLEAFGGRLRDELDLEALGNDLRGVVRESVQPAHVSLWLQRREKGS